MGPLLKKEQHSDYLNKNKGSLKLLFKFHNLFQIAIRWKITMNDYQLLIIIFILVGLSEIISGLPLLLEKVKPNWLYGLRFLRTMPTEEIWYKSNKYFGRDIVVSGILLVLASLLLLLFKSSLSVIETFLFCLFLITLPIIIILIRAFIYLKKLSS